MEYMRKKSDVGYKIENHDNKAKYTVKNKNYVKIKRQLIINLEKYNIQ